MELRATAMRPKSCGSVYRKLRMRFRLEAAATRLILAAMLVPEVDHNGEWT